MYFLFLVFSLVFSSTASYPQIINITKDYELEEFLCSGTQLLNDTTVKLSTNISHFIRNASFCIINTTYSLSITSNSSQQAIIQCNDSIIQPTSGFAFISIRNLTLQRLVLRGCGGYLKGLDVMNLINSTDSPLTFSQNHSAVLLFLHINTLLINEVTITYYYGFAVFSINPSNASINHSEISVSYGGKHGMNGFGSGIFLFFTDIIDVQPFTLFSVSIHYTVFKTNYEFAHHPSDTCLSDLMKLNIECLPIANAAGLTVLYTQKNFTAEVHVSQSNFISNRGALTGAVLVMYFNSVTQSQTVISSTIFKNNFINERCPGMCISLFFHVSNKKQNYIENDQLSPLTIFNCSFFYDQLSSMATTLGLNYIFFHYPLKVYTVVKFQKVNFTSIHSSETGTCLYALSDVHDSSSLRNDYVQIIMENITAEKNVQISEFAYSYGISLFAVQSIGSLFLNGSSFFTDNQGSVFGVFNTKIVLEGILHFSNNFAYIGSVFNVIGSSWFILNDGLNANFSGNSAVTKGGAIYAYNEQTQECMFTPNGSNNISMLFHDNTASYSGSSIFSNNLYNCEAGYTYFSPSEAETFYHKISKGTLDGGLSTVINKLCICWQQKSSNCTKSLDGTIVYPGMTLHFPVAALDVFNQVTSAEISLTLLNYSTISEATFFTLNRKWYLESPIQIITQKNCTMINVTFLKHTSNYHDDDPVLLLLVKLSQNQGNPKIHIYLVPRECPVGFEFYNSRCDCSHVLRHFEYQPVCKISSDGYNPLITITLPVKTLSHWIGIINIKNVPSFGVSTVCYLYCNFNNKYDTYIINDNNNSILITASNKSSDKAESLCLKNRAGVLCSQCAPGYSVVFGSNNCIRCCNWWLLTIIVYGIAGPLLVYLLYAFKLTLTAGEINGIIFYAQVMSIGRVMQVHTMKDIGFVSLKSYTIFVQGLISLINLTINFNLSLCLYDGMTELWKSGIGLMFPVYLLTIVIGLIIISRYSIRLSNRIADSSVQVLVTVVHLSFTTLLSSTLDVFTPAYISTNTSDVPLKVWQNDGTVEYGKGGHLILMIVTGVVVGSILITYLTVLLAGRPLMKINKVREYLRPIYEAIHAPYKRNKEFFFSLSIILVAFLYLLSYIFIGNNHPMVGLAIGIPVTGIYFTIAAFSRPFKEMYINILNVIIFTVTGIVVGTIWFFYMNLNSTAFMIVSATCDTLVILVLVSIILIRIPFVRRFSAKFDIIFKGFKLNKGNISSHCQRAMLEGSFFQSCDEKEPLLYSPT